MRIAAILATTLCLVATSASAGVYKVSDDRGGQIGKYLITLNEVRNNHDRVVVDGNCLSACTLLLGLIPRNRVCSTERARFGFHAAWMPDSDGRPVTSALGTQALWHFYPGDVRRWITRHGGLKRKMIYLQGRELAGYVHSCEQPAKTRTARATKTHRQLVHTANARAR